MVRRLLKAVFVSLVISISVEAQAAAITSAEYLPLADGNVWTYSVDGFSTLTVTVLPGTKLINAVWTKELQQSDGQVDYFTSDTNGIRQHGEFDPSPIPSIGPRDFQPAHRTCKGDNRFSRYG